MVPSVTNNQVSLVAHDPSVSWLKRKYEETVVPQTKKRRLRVEIPAVRVEIPVDCWGVIVSFLDRINLLNIERVSRAYKDLSEHAWQVIALQEGMETPWPDMRINARAHSQKWGYFLSRTFQRLLHPTFDPACREHEVQGALILGRHFPISSCPIFFHTALHHAPLVQKGAIKEEIKKIDYLANQADYKVCLIRKIEHLMRLEQEQRALAYTNAIKKQQSLLKVFDELVIEKKSFTGISDEDMQRIAGYIDYMQKIEQKGASDLSLQGFVLNCAEGNGEAYWVEAIGKGARWILREKAWMDQLFSAFLQNKNELFLRLGSTLSARGEKEELIYIAEQLKEHFSLAHDSAVEYGRLDALEKLFKTLMPEQAIYVLFLACSGGGVGESAGDLLVYGEVKYPPIIFSLLKELKHKELSFFSIEALSQLGELFIAFNEDLKMVDGICRLIMDAQAKLNDLSLREAVSMARFLWIVGNRSEAYRLYAKAIALYSRFNVKVDWEVCGDTPDKLFAIGELYRYLCRDQTMSVGICSYKYRSQYSYFYLTAFENGFPYSPLQLERIVNICYDLISQSKALDLYIEPLRRLLIVENVGGFSKQALIQILVLFEVLEDHISMEKESLLITTNTNGQLHISVSDNPFSEEVVSAFESKSPARYLALEKELGSMESLPHKFLGFLQEAVPAIRLCRKRLANESQGDDGMDRHLTLNELIEQPHLI